MLHINMWTSAAIPWETSKTLCVNYCRHWKDIIRYKSEKETIYDNQEVWFNDQSAAKTSIDFSIKYTSQLKIQMAVTFKSRSRDAGEAQKHNLKKCYKAMTVTML